MNDRGYLMGDGEIVFGSDLNMPTKRQVLDTIEKELLTMENETEVLYGTLLRETGQDALPESELDPEPIHKTPERPRVIRRSGITKNKGQKRNRRIEKKKREMRKRNFI